MDKRGHTLKGIKATYLTMMIKTIHAFITAFAMLATFANLKQIVQTNSMNDFKPNPNERVQTD